jgi:hypothetical protein
VVWKIDLYPYSDEGSGPCPLFQWSCIALIGTPKIDAVIARNFLYFPEIAVPHPRPFRLQVGECISTRADFLSTKMLCLERILNMLLLFLNNLKSVMAAPTINKAGS